MSFFSSIGKALRVGVGTVLGAVGGPIGQAAAGQIIGTIAKRPTMPVVPGSAVGYSTATPTRMVRSPYLQQASLARISPTLARAAPPLLGNLLPDIGVPGPGVFSPQQPPKGYKLSKSPPYRFVRIRRMNPTNHKAAMRAARRLIAFRKVVQRTEKALRKAVPPAARRRTYRTGAHKH